MKTVNYKDVKGNLKKSFNEFMNDPEKFGVPKEQAAEIQKLHGVPKHGMWKMFKKVAQLKINELNTNESAEALTIDLKEDNVGITVPTLKAILKTPENPDFCLESDMIKHINPPIKYLI